MAKMRISVRELEEMAHEEDKGILKQRIEELEKSKEGAVDVCRALIALNEDGDRVVPIETVKLMAADVVEKEDDGKEQN